MENKRPEAVNEAQAKHLREHPACVISGVVGSCQAHHVVPYEYLVTIGREDLTTDPRIFRTLAETEAFSKEPNWHLKAGHYGSFGSYNPDFDEELAWFKSMPYEQLIATKDFLNRVAHRPKPAHLMDTEEIAALRAWVDAKYPKVSA